MQVIVLNHDDIIIINNNNIRNNEKWNGINHSQMAQKNTH